jgi:hypothetical protein
VLAGLSFGAVYATRQISHDHVEMVLHSCCAWEFSFKEEHIDHNFLPRAQSQVMTTFQETIAEFRVWRLSGQR